MLGRKSVFVFRIKFVFEYCLYYQGRVVKGGKDMFARLKHRFSLNLVFEQGFHCIQTLFS